MEAIKEYPQPRNIVLNTVLDIIELQNAKITFSDTPNGRIGFLVKFYANKWEHQFTVKEIGENQTSVKIEIVNGTNAGEKQLKREFALMDALLVN